MGLWLVASGTRAKDFDPLNDPVPKAVCGHSDHTNPNSRVRRRRRSDPAATPNVHTIAISNSSANTGVMERIHKTDRRMQTTAPTMQRTISTSLQQHLGVTVVDVSDPKHPYPTAYLNDTAAARSPHETLQVNQRRHLLAVAQFNGPDFAVYDVSDCRHPVLKADIAGGWQPRSHGQLHPETA